MNRRKKPSSLGFPSLLLLGIAVVIVSSSGIGYVVMKNKQVTARSEIAKVLMQIDEHQMTIDLHQSDIRKILGYVQLRKDLNLQNSLLRDIEFTEVYQESDGEPQNHASVARN
jgi:hypothetical protein